MRGQVWPPYLFSLFRVYDRFSSLEGVTNDKSQVLYVVLFLLRITECVFVYSAFSPIPIPALKRS